MKQVLIIDDDSLIREYLTKSGYNLFGDSEIFSTSTMQDALTIARTIEPKVILLDLILPDTRGLEGLDELRSLCPDACIIVISGSTPPENQVHEMKESADGFLSKSGHHLTELANAIRKIEEGHAIFETPREPVRVVTHSYSGLSPVENQVLQMFLNGLSIRDVINETGKSDSYIKSLRRNIREKLGDQIFNNPR
jgi:DNA-binding NarL/FixJ family response regulator